MLAKYCKTERLLLLECSFLQCTTPSFSRSIFHCKIISCIIHAFDASFCNVLPSVTSWESDGWLIVLNSNICLLKPYIFLQASFVLCRVFVKSHGRNSTSENVLNSCAEESASAFRHIGIQTSEINSFGRLNDMSRYPVSPDSEPAQIMTGPVTVSSIQFPSDIQPKEQVMF